MPLLAKLYQAHYRLPACPADAHQSVKDILCIKVLGRKGGEGCVREFIEYLLI